MYMKYPVTPKEFSKVILERICEHSTAVMNTGSFPFKSDQ